MHFYVSNSTQDTFPVIPYFSARGWNSWEIQRLLIGNIYDGVIMCQVLQTTSQEHMSSCSDFLMLHISEQFNKEKDSSALDLELIAFAVRDYFQTVQISYTYLWKKENHDLFEIRIEGFKKERKGQNDLLVHLCVGLKGPWYWMPYIIFFKIGRWISHSVSSTGRSHFPSSRIGYERGC